MTETARIVIGADGRTSGVARLVGASSYDEIAPRQGTYLTYWRNVPMLGTELHVRPSRGVYAIPTNDNLTPVGVNWAMVDFGPVRADPEANYRTQSLPAPPNWANSSVPVPAPAASSAERSAISCANHVAIGGRWLAILR